MRYILLALAVIFLGSGIVQGALTIVWQDWIGLVGAVVQLGIGTILLTVFLTKQKQHTIRQYKLRMRQKVVK